LNIIARIFKILKNYSGITQTDNTTCVVLVGEILKNVNVKRDIAYIRSNFAFITLAITNPKASRIPVHDPLANVAYT
jgi:hypothetical protein